jgi:hypothetical protein
MFTFQIRCWLLVLPLIASCNGGSPPSAPTRPSPASISITGTDLILVGSSETFTALNETGAALGGWWGTDAPTIAAVEAYTGRVTAVGSGTATIFVDAKGTRATKSIRTLPNFSGTWGGTYEETACEASGDFVVLRVCPISEYDFHIGQMRMTLTQIRDSVSGEVKLRGGMVSDVSGNISPEGTLTFTGAARDQSKFDIELQNVRFELPQRDEMTGTFEEVYLSRIATPSGGWRMVSRIRKMIR